MSADVCAVVACAPDQAHVLTAGYDRVAIVWDPHHVEPLARLVGHDDIITSVAVSSDGMGLRACVRVRVCVCARALSQEPLQRAAPIRPSVCGRVSLLPC